MLIDFHTHGKLSKAFPFSPDYTRWLLHEAKAAGLDAICLTEHFNTLEFERLYHYIADNAVADGDTFLFDGLRIFIGMETDIAESGHILTLGTLEDMLELNRRLAPYKQKGGFLPFKDLLDLFDEYPVIVGAAHPFRAGGNIPELPEDQIRRFHFFDLNGKDVALDRARTERLTYGFGERFNKPVIGGSDTHQANQYGCIGTRFDREINTIKDLYDQMLAGNYTIEISPQATQKVKAAGVLKMALKEIHALGGDYVSVLLDGKRKFQLEPMEYNREYGTTQSANI